MRNLYWYMPGLTEKVFEKLPEPSPSVWLSSCGSHGVNVKEPATKTGAVVPGFEYVVVNDDDGMAANVQHTIFTSVILRLLE